MTPNEERQVTPISLVLLPGLDGTGILFLPLIAALPKTINPIVVSYPPDHHLTYQQLLPLVRQSLPKTEPFILLGESFSGPLAIMAAAEHPTNLVGLILCATFVTRPIPILSPLVPILARSMVFRFFPKAQRIKAVLGRYSTSELQELFARVHAEVSPAVIAARVRAVFGIDVREALRSCDVPMMYIAAERDMVVPNRNFRVIQRIVPEIQLVKINCSHGIPQAKPIEAARVIASFADRLSDAEASP